MISGHKALLLSASIAITAVAVAIILGGREIPIPPEENANYVSARVDSELGAGRELTAVTDAAPIAVAPLSPAPREHVKRMRPSQYKDQLAYPEGDLEDAVDILERRALSGDADAAFMLSRLFRQCVPFEGKPLVPACGRLRQDPITATIRWLEAAADLNNVVAQIELLPEVQGLLGLEPHRVFQNPQWFMDLRARAHQHVLRARNSGYPDAITTLAQANESGWLGPPNLIEAYAYYHVLDLVQAGKGSGALHRIGERLTSAQIDRAIQLGNGYFDLCCN